MEEKMNPIVKWLEQRRLAERMSMRAFALKLGLTPAIYTYLVKGDRQPGNKVREAVKRTYPDAPNCIFLPSGLNNSVKADVK